MVLQAVQQHVQVEGGQVVPAVHVRVQRAFKRASRLSSSARSPAAPASMAPPLRRPISPAFARATSASNPAPGVRIGFRVLRVDKPVSRVGAAERAHARVLLHVLQSPGSAQGYHTRDHGEIASRSCGSRGAEDGRQC